MGTPSRPSGPRPRQAADLEDMPEFVKPVAPLEQPDLSGESAPPDHLEVVLRTTAWARSQASPALTIETVPGASELERQHLAAVGGIAAALAAEQVDGWPPGVREWARNGPRPPSALVEALRRSLGAGPDVLALIYEDLVSGESRRRLGTFFTPPAVVSFMLDRAEELMGTPASIVDPGAGVGAFALAAKRRWPESAVLCVDVNVVTLGLLAARSTNRLDLVHEDFLTWAPAQAGAGEPRLWIGNPPYTRHHELTADQKEQATKASGILVPSRLAGLSAYFLAVSLMSIGANDSLCFLLPANWTDARYGRNLRTFLSSLHDRPVEFYGFETDVDVFPGTRVAAMVVAVGPVRASSSELASLSTATARLDSNGVSTVARTVRERSNIESLGLWLWPRPHPNLGSEMRVGDIARVRRGIATGANNHFLLTDEARAAFPEGVTVPILRRLRHVKGDRLTMATHTELGARGERGWLLSLSEASDLTHRSIQDWMSGARAAGIDKRYLVRNREPWYQVEAITPPDAIVSSMGKHNLHAVVNEAGVLISNSLYGLYLEGDRALATRLVRWLNGPAGQAALAERARIYGSGLLKLEPRDLAAVRIPLGLLMPGVRNAQRPRTRRSPASTPDAK